MLTVFIQRKSNFPDDEIHVSTQDGHRFAVVYFDRDSRVRQAFTTDRRGLTDYFYNIFDVITMDDEPFHSIQFNLPVYPIVLFNIDKLNTAKINRFMNILRDSIEKFPFHVRNTVHTPISALNAYRG